VPFHVRITLVPEIRSWTDELALDLTREEVERRFLASRREERPVVVRGRTLSWDQIERIRINETEQTSIELLPIIRSRREAEPFAAAIPDEWYVTEEGRDVTDELITEPVASVPGRVVEPAMVGMPRDARQVAVAYGRDEEAVEAIFDLLKDLGLRPLRWEQLRAMTGKATPYTGEIVETAFAVAQAVVVLFTPDDEARLHPQLCGDADRDHEREMTGQPRQNVLIEAGMALNAHPTQTIIVEIGHLRPISNLDGLNTVRIAGSDTVGPLNELIARLETARCPVDRNGGWTRRIAKFERLAAITRRASAAPPPDDRRGDDHDVDDDLRLEISAAGHRAGINLNSRQANAIAHFLLRRGQEPFGVAEVMKGLPAPSLTGAEAKKLAIRLEGASLIERSTTTPGWVSTAS
jgi:predicted nucleotide-binding protein